jgi:hypothetical protein
MSVYVITESGQRIELPPALVNGGPGADAYVAAQIASSAVTPAEPDVRAEPGPTPLESAPPTDPEE